MPRALFVVTTEENMGDLALCEEWMGDLSDGFTFAFVLCRNLAKYVSDRYRCYTFQADVDVADTIRRAVRDFAPDAVIFASNSFWNIRGQKGATFGRFPLEAIEGTIPVLSFDPFESGFRTRLGLSEKYVEFPSIPKEVWRLRYMSRASGDPMARHFCTRAPYDRARAAPRERVLEAHGADPGKKTVVLPVSLNRLNSILAAYPRYYVHLARLFAMRELRDVQFLVIRPRPIPGLGHAPNVIDIPLVPFEEFLEIIAASDVYLTDSLISCMVSAIHLGVPTVLLSNSGQSQHLESGSFLDGNSFPYKVFPYGFADVCDTLVNRFEIRGCFEEVEVLDARAFVSAMCGLLFDQEIRGAATARCHEWKKARMVLPSPRQTLEAILRETAS
ncbi:MAG TPA: DUF6365 family protein [Thermoanaerobaculia bacterium]|jgi:hypothetical protein|nr:DUF6365 family protein [Thermoanaerobaculia bacterium]